MLAFGLYEVMGLGLGGMDGLVYFSAVRDEVRRSVVM